MALEKRTVKPTTFALFVGTRTFFPPKYIKQARTEIPRVLKSLGNDFLEFPASRTKTGGIETTQDGEKYARWLERNRGKFGGVILSQANFADERGVVAALRDARVPIYIQTYPDRLDAMGNEDRRDGFCGRISITDNLWKYRIPFTILPPHTLDVKDPRFKEQVRYFDRVCRVANGLRRLRVGAIGARTTAFKTVRIDEDALEAHGISVETYDLLDVYFRMEAVKESDSAFKEKVRDLKRYSLWPDASRKALPAIAKLGVVLDRIIEEDGLHAIALRCWIELQKYLSISPCVLMSRYNDRGVPAACEVDIGNAVTMYALMQASGDVAACLDWNNNYGTGPETEDRAILFHCGPVPQKMMRQKGWIEDHPLLARDVGKGKGYGCNQGRIKPGPFTFASMRTWAGKPEFYVGEGEFTKDPIPKEFFGCAGVVKIPELQKVLLYICNEGHRHHTSVTPGNVVSAVYEALTKYRDMKVAQPQEA